MRHLKMMQKIDGRGFSLNRYDGAEDEEKVNGIIYYIYKQ